MSCLLMPMALWKQPLSKVMLANKGDDKRKKTVADNNTTKYSYLLKKGNRFHRRPFSHSQWTEYSMIAPVMLYMGCSIMLAWNAQTSLWCIQKHQLHALHNILCYFSRKSALSIAKIT